LRDVRSGLVWSAAYHPTCREPEEYLVTFLPERAVFRRRDDEIETQLEIAVSPEDDVEVRRLSLTNRSDRPREIEVTSYAEPVLGPAADDLAHPAFGKLFLETEYVPHSAALVCHRGGLRPRGGARARAEVSRPGIRRPHLRPRLHPRARRAAPSRDHERRGAPVRAARLPGTPHRRFPPRRSRVACAQHAGATGPLALQHLGRPADPAREGRRGERPAARAP